MNDNVITKQSGCKQHAANNLFYIGTRTGSEHHVTVQSQARNQENQELINDTKNKSHALNYVDYMGNRTGVIVEGENTHGLFDANGTPDIYEIGREINSLNNTPVYAMIISLRESTANHLDFNTKEDWEIMARANMPYIAEQLDIPLENLNWVGAVHDKEGQPHAHFLVWDKTDKTRPRGWKQVPSNRLKKIRRLNADAVYGERAAELSFTKTEYRDYIINELKGDSGKIIEFLKDANTDKKNDMHKYMNDDDIEQSTKDMIDIVNLLPTKGSTKYRYLPPETKAIVDKAVDNLINSEGYKKSYEGYLDQHTKQAGKYVSDKSKLNEKRQNADREIRTRMANVLLKYATEYRNNTAKETDLKAEIYESSNSASSDDTPDGITDVYFALDGKRSINYRPIKDNDINEYRSILDNRMICIETIIENSKKDSDDNKYKLYLLKTYKKYALLNGNTVDDSNAKINELNSKFEMSVEEQELLQESEKVNNTVSKEDIFIKGKSSFIHSLKLDDERLEDARAVIENEDRKFVSSGANTSQTEKVKSNDVSNVMFRALRDLSTTLNEKERLADKPLTVDRFGEKKKKEAEQNRSL